MAPGIYKHDITSYESTARVSNREFMGSIKAISHVCLNWIDKKKHPESAYPHRASCEE